MQIGRLWALMGAIACASWIFAPGTTWADAQSAFEVGKAAHERGDVIAAIELLTAAAEEGHVPAMVRLGYVLNKSGDSEAAFRVYSHAAEAGDLEAVLAVGTMYASGDGVDMDHAKALDWIRRAAEGGHGPAILSLAMIHINGDLGTAVNREEGMRWLRIGVDAGYAPAQAALDRLQGKQLPRRDHASKREDD